MKSSWRIICLFFIFTFLFIGCSAEPEEVVDYIDGYIVANYEKYVDDEYRGKDVYVKGTITTIKNENDLYIKDSNGDVWWLAVYSHFDFNEYVGTECEFYGKALGQSGYGAKRTPMLGLVETEHKLIFCDGKTYYQFNQDECSEFPTFPTEPAIETTIREDEPSKDQNDEVMVWVTASGSKYHRNKGCSSMEDPMQISKEDAIARGYEACKRCN